MIPIPLFFGNSNRISFGLFLYESNFFGKNKKLYGGGIYVSSGWNTYLGYMYPSIAGTFFTVRLSGGYLSKEFENTDTSGEILRKYYADSLYFHYGLGYNYKVAGILTPSIEGYFRKTEMEENPENFQAPDSKFFMPRGSAFSTKISIILYYSSFSNSGIEGCIEYLHGFSLRRNIPGYDEVQGYLRLAAAPGINHLLSFYLLGGAGNPPPAFWKRIGGKYGFKTLPAEKPLPATISRVLFYEVALLHLSWGTLTGLVFYEAGRLLGEKGWEFFMGPGTGFRLYLQNVAFSAIGLDGAYNLQT